MFGLTASRSPRNRLLYAALVVVVIGLGLFSRSDTVALPSFVAKYAGDAFWAVMIFLGFGILLPARNTLLIATLAAVVCSLVECSQLYHAPWIDSCRHTRFDKLTLGDTFGWGDLAAYLAGIATAALADRIRGGRPKGASHRGMLH